MNLSHFISNEPDELIAKGSSKNVPWFGLFLIVPILGLLFDSTENQREFFLRNPVIAVLLTLFLVCGSVYFWYIALDKRIKLIINSQGIAFKGNNFLAWENIGHYYIKEQIVKAKPYHFLYLKDALQDRLYKMEITFLDKTFQEIQSTMSHFSKGKSTIDLGFESNR